MYALLVTTIFTKCLTLTISDYYFDLHNLFIEAM